MQKKKPDYKKLPREDIPIITEEITEISSLASATECTGMGKIFPNADDEDFDIGEIR